MQRAMMQTNEAGESVLGESVPMWEDTLGQEAEDCVRDIIQAGDNLIRARFRLGGIVYDALRHGDYGDGVVVRMACRLTRGVGKRISPSTLYQAARVFHVFRGDYSKVERLGDALSFPLSYTFLVRHCLPVLTTHLAWNAEELRHQHENQLTSWESTVVQIEERFSRTQASRTPHTAMPADLMMGEEGFRAVCDQSEGYRQFALGTLLRRASGLVQLLEMRRGELSEQHTHWLATLSGRLSVLANVVLQRSGTTDPKTEAAA